jgi:arsenate reductase
MAEAFLKQMAGDRYEVYSAGLEPGELNPLAVKAIAEAGIDISKNKTKSVFDFYREGKLFSYVITVCDQASSERCPIFPGITRRLHWSFEDPSSFSGSEEDKLKKTIAVRDSIKRKIKEWLEEIDKTG